jgi:DNA-binding beta-propeller fold protein YncE
MLRAIDIEAPADVRTVIASLGRTEDVTFSPNNERLAVACFGNDLVVVFDVAVDDGGTRPRVRLSGPITMRSDSLNTPHGLCFLDDDTLVVANRGGEVPIFALPPRDRTGRAVSVYPLCTIRADNLDGLDAPGSVTAARLAPDLFEVLVCNNDAGNVSHHVVDARDGYRVLNSEVVLAAGLDVPDGVALSADRCWLAVSNHEHHKVFVYRNRPDLAVDTPSDGALCGMLYPHGLRFTADGRHVVVADAAAPHVYVYTGAGGDWTGTRRPSRSVRVMDDATFLRGHCNPEEGGPKGLDIDRTSRVMLVTSEHQPLAFFDLRDLLPGVRPTALGSADADADAVVEAGRRQLVHGARRVAELEGRLAGLRSDVTATENKLADLADALVSLEGEVASLRAHLAVSRTEAEHQRLIAEDRARQLAALHASTSWRATAPARQLASKLRRG